MSRYLAYSDIWTTAYLPGPESLVRFAGGRSGLLWQLARLKQQSGTRIDLSVSPEISPLVQALALGERGAISLSQRQRLARGGVAHLFAISGLHMGFLAIFGYQLLLFVYRRSSHLLRWQPPQRVLPLILLPLLFVYLLLTGDALSTRRAFLTCACIAFLLIWRRRVAPLQILFTLALLFLLLEPLALWQASFQLSFAGVAGILCWKRYWLLEESRQPWLLKKISQIFLVSLAATLATAPWVLLNFQMFSIAGIINNLFAIPLVGLLAVPSGLLGVILTACYPALADPFFIMCGYVLSMTVQLIDWVILIPGLSGEMLYISRWQLILFTMVSLVLMLPWKRLISPVLILSVLLLFILFPTGQDQKGLSLTSFAVGQGESFLLSIDGDRHVLVDGGGLYSESFDVGERLLAPALGLLGVSRLDAVLLTHDHPDHSKGLSYLFEHFSVGSFWCGSEPSELSSTLQAVLIGQRIPVRQFHAG